MHFPLPISKFPVFQLNSFRRVFSVFFLFLFFAVSTPGLLRAKNLSLEEAEGMAVESSLEVRLAGTDVKIHEGLRKEAAGAYYPQVYSKLVAPFIGRESGFFADQIIWDFGRTKNRVKSQENLIAMAGFSKQNAANEAVRQVRKAFYRVLFEEAHLIYVEKNHQLAVMNLERSRVLEKNGRISPLDLAQQESDEKSVLFELSGVKNRVQSARFELFQLLGITDGNDIILETPKDGESVFPPPEKIVSEVLKNNPSLLGLNERLKSYESDMAAARAEFLPVFYGRVAYRFKGEGAETPAFIAGAGATIPIFQGLSRFGSLDRTRAAYQRAEIRIALEKQRLEREIRRLLLNISHADSNIDLSKKNLDTAEKKLILAREKEKIGASSKLDLVFAEKEYAKFYLQYEESVYNKRLLLVDLKFLAGQVVTGGGKGEIQSEENQ